MKHVKLYEAFLSEKLSKPKKPKSFVVKGYTDIDENVDTPKGQFVEFVLSQVEPKKDYKTLEEYTKAMIDIALSQYSFGDNDTDAKFIKDFCEENWNDETPSDKIEEDGDKERYARIVKDIDEVRPRMAPAPKTDGMMASQGTKFFELYLQDEASYVCVDKYGYEKGIKNWEYYGAIINAALTFAKKSGRAEGVASYPYDPDMGEIPRTKAADAFWEDLVKKKKAKKQKTEDSEGGIVYTISINTL